MIKTTSLNNIHQMKAIANSVHSVSLSVVMNRIDKYALLETDEMGRADRMTIQDGIAGKELMEAAGLSIVRLIVEKYDQGPAMILCGTGNNGGDGFVIARHLKEAGWPVEVALLGEVSALKGDAALMADRWDGPVVKLSSDILQNQTLVVDGIFGAGLCRSLEGEVAAVIEKVNAMKAVRVAVDVPSGIMGDSGQVAGVAFEAHMTVTFFRRKPAHLLYPGRKVCGEVYVTDIGISDRVLGDINPACHVNHPDVWKASYPVLQPDGHKYDRGHAVVVSGDGAHGGAARLAAKAALRMGAGLTTVLCPQGAVAAHAAQLNAVMIRDFSEFDMSLADERLNVWCLGPANGVTAQTRDRVLSVLNAGRSVVLDADGLSVFEDNPQDLFDGLNSNCVLTPHGGEFARLFPEFAAQDKLSAARAAAALCGAVVLYKGADTVVAEPGGRAVISENAPPTLATAGSGDVLAGMITGLLAQGMPAFEAACAAVWCHGEAARKFGPGLISEDIESLLPSVIGGLKISL